jgi:thiamine pyrophosphokinase
MQLIVLADGQVGTRDAIDAAWPDWIEPDAYVVAADGGARHAAGLGLRIDRWVGDGDSLGEAGLADLIAAGIPVERARPDKDASDTELAIIRGLERKPSGVTIVGALGGPRLDHALANLGLLAMPELRGRDVRLVTADARVRLMQAPGPSGEPVRLSLAGASGDGVSLLPIGDDALGITTGGLRYPLRDEPLQVGRTRGLSNERTDPTGAAVTLREGYLLVVETPARLWR